MSGAFLITIISLQILYVLMGTAMNLLSLWHEKSGRRPLTTTPPRRGLVSMMIAAGLTLAFFVLPLWAYAAAWIWFCMRVLRGALRPHLRAVMSGDNLSAYTSRTAALAALSINTFGFTVGVIGAWFALRLWLAGP